MLPDNLTAEQVLGIPVAETRCIADIQAEPLRWLWPGRIPLGKLSIISGDPGLGKSLVTLAIAAAVSRRSPWPCREGDAPLGDVVLLSAEDDPADTLRPRLEAAGADLQRIHVLDHVVAVDSEGADVKRPWNFRDTDSLRQLLVGNPNCRLVIVDPISAYLAGTDTHKNSDVRSLLAPLAELAARSGVAVLAVSHLNKSAGPAIYRTSGSLAFVAAARAAYAVARDKADGTRRLVLPLKCNLSADLNGLAYKIGVAENGSPVVQWEAQPVSMSADEALEVVTDAAGDHSELEEAIEWLRGYLSNGPQPAKSVFDAGRDAGFSRATLRRAQKRLGICPSKSAFNAGWEWALPAKMLTNSEDAHPKSMSTFEENEHLGQSKGCTAEEYRRAKNGD